MPTVPLVRRSSGGHGMSDVFHGRYKVLDEVGRGNFARVVRARDLQTNKMVAVKMLSPQYARDAQFELDMLKIVAEKDRNNAHKVCKLLEQFKENGTTYFVFDLLGPSLKSRRSYGVTDPASRRVLQNLVRELSRALQYLHFDCRMVHTDLKPENILLDDPNDTSAGLGDGWTIVDLGSASFYSEKPDQDLISTRPYRAPEVLVGAPWSYAADMWSFGCILYELYTGRMLFDVSSDAQHLQLIERRVGPAPAWLAETAEPKARQQLFDSTGRLRPSTRAGPPKPFAQDIKADPEFVDLLRRLLHYDPATRLRADEVLSHGFVKGAREAAQETGILTRLPPSAYTSGAIKTPGCKEMQRGIPRDSLDCPLAPEAMPSAPGFGGPRDIPEEMRLNRRASAATTMDYEREKELIGFEKKYAAAAAAGRYGTVGLGGAASAGIFAPASAGPPRQEWPAFRRPVPDITRRLPHGHNPAPALHHPHHHQQQQQQPPHAHGGTASRALFAAEESLRAISAADAALYNSRHLAAPASAAPTLYGSQSRRPFVPPPKHHHRF
ncbi:Serine/threonine-protein kinase Doa [Diplonema papillatum]|nr:Serine/threonine-protein kinase Doa [Diplonema papillatum]